MCLAAGKKTPTPTHLSVPYSSPSIQHQTPSLLFPLSCAESQFHRKKKSTGVTSTAGKTCLDQHEFPEWILDSAGLKVELVLFLSTQDHWKKHACGHISAKWYYFQSKMSSEALKVRTVSCESGKIVLLLIVVHITTVQKLNVWWVPLKG